MNSITSTTRLAGLVLVLSAAPVCAAAGPGHPTVAVEAGCVTSECHARLLAAVSGARTGSVHQPASEGDCRSCHDLALAAGSHFVKGALSGPGEGSGIARAWDLVLCTGCHGEVFLAADAPPGATGFVDGKRNLHTHHVQAGRGNRCLPCHDPHAARQPKLLRDRIPARGNARIAQEFRGSPTGGWCKTGCHAPKSYSR